MAAIVIVFVLAQSIFFLVKALRRSKQLGMDQAKIKKTIKTAAIFTIAPAVAIVISVMTLSKKLGLPLPWLRLSVVGSMSYETIAAANAARGTPNSRAIASPETVPPESSISRILSVISFTPRVQSDRCIVAKTRPDGKVWPPTLQNPPISIIMKSNLVTLKTKGENYVAFKRYSICA
mgnify:CR=1 FL=1